MVLHPSGPIAQRRFFHRRLPTTGAYGCLHQRLERKRQALRLDQEKGPPTPLQRQAYHSTLIPGTRVLRAIPVGSIPISLVLVRNGYSSPFGPDRRLRADSLVLVTAPAMFFSAKAASTTSAS